MGMAPDGPSDLEVVPFKSDYHAQHLSPMPP